MPAATLNLTGAYVIEQGATWSVIVVAEDSGGSPINLTGYSARCEFRDTYTGTQQAKPTCTVTDDLNGEITMSLTAAETEAIGTPGVGSSGVYDLEVYSGATVIRVVKGNWTVDPEVTRVAS